MLLRGTIWCSILALIVAGCESGAVQNTSAAKRPADRAVAASFNQGPAPTGRTHVVGFVRPGQDSAGHGGLAHIAVPVSLNDGPPRAFILDTGAPVTTVLISKDLLKLTSVAQKLEAASPTRIQGISGATATAYRTTARSIPPGYAVRS